MDSKISYSVDVWTAANWLAFLGVTAHWMDREFELHSTIFDFIPITGRHTGDNLGELFFESLKKAGTLKKVCELSLHLSFCLFG